MQSSGERAACSPCENSRDPQANPPGCPMVLCWFAAKVERRRAFIADLSIRFCSEDKHEKEEGSGIRHLYVPGCRLHGACPEHSTTAKGDSQGSRGSHSEGTESQGVHQALAGRRAVSKVLGDEFGYAIGSGPGCEVLADLP